LFSGGGNDVVGEDLLPLLNQRKPGMTWEQCLNAETTDARFDRLRSAYVDLIHLRDENQPECRIYLHGYDWAFPSGKGSKLWGIKAGPWMRPHLESKGITDPADQRQIIHALLERFAAMQRQVVQNHSNVVLVPTQGTLGKADWHDEIHPTRDGFKRIAEKFRAELRKQFPATF
jgi:hypothetical protein